MLLRLLFPEKGDIKKRCMRPSASLYDYALESWLGRRKAVRVSTHICVSSLCFHPGTPTDHGLRKLFEFAAVNPGDQQTIKAETGNGVGQERCRAQKFEAEAIGKELLFCMIWLLLCLLILPSQMVHWTRSYHRFTTRFKIEASPSSSFGLLRYTRRFSLVCST